MKITSISVQARDSNRVNVSVDGKYRFSLDIFQVSDLGLRVGQEYTEQELASLEQESQFGKLYARALEYSLSRPRSVREMRDYLYKKTYSVKRRSSKAGEVYEKLGVPRLIADRVLERLIDKDYVNDEKFAEFWVEYRFQRKGVSLKRLRMELAQKGVDSDIIERALDGSSRDDQQELQKILAKKRSRYPDEQKLMQYLARQGFSFDDIKSAIEDQGEKS